MWNPSTIGSLLADARRALGAAPFRPPRREAQLLLGHVLELSEAGVLAHPDRAVAQDTVARFQGLLERRLRGEPVAYLAGEREFYGRPFEVDPRVLIPRPETEHLIEAALGLDLPEHPRVLDVGTGSGCIAATLALEFPEARLVATDLSLAALRVAHANSRVHQVEERMTCVQADLAMALQISAFDLVVSNPPYVNVDDPATSLEVSRFEPHLALFAPDAGRAVVEALLEAAQTLRPGAHLLVEIGYDQGRWLRSAVEGRAALELVDLVRDYSDIPRIAIVRATSSRAGSAGQRRS